MDVVSKLGSNLLASLGTEAELRTTGEGEYGRLEIRTAVIALVCHLFAAYRKGSLGIWNLLTSGDISFCKHPEQSHNELPIISERRISSVSFEHSLNFIFACAMTSSFLVRNSSRIQGYFVVKSPLADS